MRRFLLVAVLAALACTRPREEEPFVLRIAAAGPFARVHPTVSETNAVLAQDLAFQTILYPDARGTATSQVADAIERLGPNRYRIRISPDARFWDGSAVEYEDVSRAARESGVAASRDGEWIVLEALSALEGRLFYAALYREAGDRVLGTGPFRVVEDTPWRIVLDRVRPMPGRVARVELVGVPTTRDALARTLRGEANGVVTLSDRQAEFLQGVPTLRVVRGPGPHSRAIVFASDRIAPEEIQALRRSLPFAEIAARACAKRDADEGELPEVAAEIPPGRPLVVGALSIDESVPLGALALRRALGARGGAIERVGLSDPNPTRLTGDLNVRSLLTWPPAALALSWTTSGPMNFAHYSNPAVDAAFARGDVAGAAAEIARSAPFVPLCRSQRIGAFDARIREASFGWWGILDTLPDWEVAP